MSGQPPEAAADSAASHVSPASRTPLPQLAGQSESTFRVNPAWGQHPSPGVGVSINVCVHRVWQPDPTRTSRVQGSSSLQLALVGQAPSLPEAIARSHVSPAS